ncbi:hypothetical protein RNZ50_04120 [Paracoccaceae bacterium Fryx2]|nr:hypothetical protein [Paracoccaceae bacterium Fryx2]
MKKTLLVSFAAVVAAGAAALAWQMATPEPAPVALAAPEGTPALRPVPADWPAEQARRTAVLDAHVAQHRVAYDWFTRFPFSQTDGTPMILLKLLPVVAPDQWAGGDAFMAEIGLFPDPDTPGPLPVGIGFSGLSGEATPTGVDYTSFTCAACHIGRVQGADGGLGLIRGGINSQFNINAYFVRLGATIDALAEGATEPDQRKAAVLEAVLTGLDTAAAQSPTFFYGDSRYDKTAFDAAYEARQIALFRADAPALAGAFVDYVDGFIGAFGTYLDKTYPGFQPQMLHGLPGMADATGVSAAHGYEQMGTGLVGRLFRGRLLPSEPGLTDFMAVWAQNDRTAEWDATGTGLINGGGQYNGNIAIPIYRNLAASMTMGLNSTDLRVAAFSADLLDGLPATPYPFAVDTALAATGAGLFAENCAACHQPNNGRVYDTLGTDPSRAGVINNMLMKGARAEYLGICNPQTTITLYGAPVTPCASFDGQSLEGKGAAIMRPLDQQAGYNATALHGAWALAPYLHTGVVPTMFHLLVPDQRPDRFVKSRLGYDTELMGFQWQEGAPGGYLFDTTAFPALTTRGHDVDVVEDGRTYRLDWSGDIPGAMALIEYLKTL